MFSKPTILAVLASTTMVLATANDAPAAPSIHPIPPTATTFSTSIVNPHYPPKPTSTTVGDCAIAIPTYPHCGCDVPYVTTIDYINCGDCYVTTTTVGPVCDLYCPTLTTVIDSTTTLTRCEATQGPGEGSTTYPAPTPV